MTKRIFNNSKNKIGNRRQKPIILIIAEDKNVTESNYFKSFQKENQGCVIKVLILGCITELTEMQHKIEKFWRENDMNEEKGDIAYFVRNLNCDENNGKTFKKLFIH